VIRHLGDRFAAISAGPGRAGRVRLGPLGEEEVAALLDSLFPGNTLAEDHPWLVPALASQSGGNAFHLMQILKVLREARDDDGEPLVSAEEGTWWMRPEVTEERLRQWIPPAVEDIVRSVADPLPERGRKILEIAAVAGEEFEVKLLGALVDGPDGLDEGLEALEQLDLIRPADEAGDQYRFTNSLVPTTIERQLRERSRRTYARLHRDLARALERRLGDRGLRPWAQRYARHLLLAGEKEEALRWYVTAAEGFVGQQLYLRADAALTRAGLLIGERVPAEEEVLGNYYFLRGEVSRVRGSLDEAVEAFENATRYLTESHGRPILARALNSMGKIHEVRGELDRALHNYRVGARLRDDLGDRGEMAHSLNNLGMVLLTRGDEEKARTAFTRAFDLAEKAGDRAAHARALDNLADLAFRGGDWDLAESLYRESLAISEREGDRLGAAGSLNGLGNMALRRGRPEEARDGYERAIAIRREVGDEEGVANLLSNLGVVHDRLGEPEAALRYYRRSAEAHRSMGSRRGLATVLNNIGVVNLARGDVGIAVERFEESLEIRTRMGDRSRIGNASLNLAEAYDLSGRTEEAAEMLERAREAFRAAPDPGGEAATHAARAAHLRRRNRIEEASASLAEGFAIEVRDPRIRSQLHLEGAELHLLRDEVEAGEAAARRGLELAEASGDRPAAARALRLRAVARHRRGDPDEALALLDRALELLAGAGGIETVRTRLTMGEVLRERSRHRSREVLMLVRGLLDAMEARGAVLPERSELDRLLTEESGDAPEPTR